MPRQHTEHLPATGGASAQAGAAPVWLRVWLSNTRQRREKLTDEQRTALGINWATD